MESPPFPSDKVGPRFPAPGAAIEGRLLRRTLEEIARATDGRILRGSPGQAVAGVSTDSRKIAGGELFVALTGERFDGRDFVARALAAGAAAALVEPGRELGLADGEGGGGLVEVESARAALLALARGHRERLSSHVVAVTGSAGKSTTKEITAHLLAGRGQVSKAPSSFNNEIGVPLTLLGAGVRDEFLVVEIGTNHPGEIAPLAAATRPDAGVITNVGPTHLEGLGSVEGVAREKASLLDHLAEGGVAVLPADDEYLELLRARAPGAVVTFGFSPEAQVRAEGAAPEGAGMAFSLNGAIDVRLPLPGRHNVANALAAAAVAWRFGMDLQEIAERLSGAATLPMRSMVVELQGITLMDDSYNANPAGFRAALAMLEERRPAPLVVIAGDMLELGAASAALHRELGGRIAAALPRLVIAVGDEMAAAAGAAVEAGLDPGSVVQFTTAADAAEQIAGLVREGDAVLVKGSRAVGLEAVAGRLCEALGRQEGQT